MPQLNVISVPTLREQRLAASHRNPIRYTRPAQVWGNDMDVAIEIHAGEMDSYRLGLPLKAYLAPFGAGRQWNEHAGELLTTPPNLASFVQKTVVDLELGREQVPLLYPPLFRTISDTNLTEDVDVGVVTSRASVVFVDFKETGEVKFGTRTITPGVTVKLGTYAAGFEYTEDMVEYDRTWQVSQLNDAFGRAYNALLNHIHLSPIIIYSYAAKNLTAASTVHGVGVDARMLNIRETIKQGMIHAGQDKLTDTGIGRSPTVLMAHSSRRWDLEEALQSRTINGTVYPALAGVDTLLFYDGYSIKVGAKTYTYGGVGVNDAYLIDTSTYLIELVKHDLRVDAAPGDLSRLIQQQVVGRTRRGVFISPPNAVEKLTLPA